MNPYQKFPHNARAASPEIGGEVARPIFSAVLLESAIYCRLGIMGQETDRGIINATDQLTSFKPVGIECRFEGQKRRDEEARQLSIGIELGGLPELNAPEVNRNSCGRTPSPERSKGPTTTSSHLQCCRCEFPIGRRETSSYIR
jgi:hypothetical protein